MRVLHRRRSPLALVGLALALAPIAACARSTVVADGSNAVAVSSAPTPASPPSSSEPGATVTSDEPTPSAPATFGDCGLRATVKSAPSNYGDFTLTLTNTSKRTLHLVEPGDGSFTARRTPTLDWSAALGDGPAPPEQVGFCGFTNPMEAAEVFELAPGASKTFEKWLGGPHVKPGTYDVKVRYRNDPKLLRNASPAVTALVAATDACEVTSNTISATFPAR